MPIPPIYDDGKLEVREKMDDRGTTFIVRVGDSKTTIEVIDAADLRDGLSEALARHGR